MRCGWPHNQSMNPETKIQNACFLAASRHPDVLVFRQQSGVFRAMNDNNRVVRVGVPGMADSGMIVPVTITADMVGQTVGIAVQAEFKTRTGKQAEAQHTWQAAVRRCAGIYRLVRSATEMEALIQDVKSGKAFKRS